MSSKTFVTISNNECQSVYKDILDNSTQKWESGERLAEVKEFGTATSLAIISVEEIIKTLIVFLDGQGFSFRKVKGMDVLFNHHQIRYFIAFLIFIMGVAGDELLNFILRYKDKPEELTDLVNHWITDMEEFELKLKQKLFRRLIHLKSESNWFSKIDLIRQDGFYCDYKEQLKTPIKISESDYLKVVERLGRVRKIVIELIEQFDQLDPVAIQYVDKIKKDFIKEGYYKKIGNQISDFRKNKQSPFDLLNSKLNQI